MSKNRLFAILKLNFSVCLTLCFALLLGIVVVFFYYVWSEKQIDIANNQRYKTRLLAQELRQTSDDLTRMIRNYAATGDSRYLDYFNQILAIRNGTLARPTNYKNMYWDYVIAGHPPSSSTQDRAIPLLDLLTQAGFTDAELAKLTEAKLKSDQLTTIEFKALTILQSSGADGETDLRKQAQMLLFDQNYHQQKADILLLIDQAIDMSDRRTQQSVYDTTRKALLIRVILIVMGGILLLLIWLCEKLFFKTLGATPEKIYLAMQQLGHGHFDPLPINATFLEHSIMGQLVIAQKRLKTLESTRLRNQQSLTLMAKVFAESQEGIFLTDVEGTVLDVNPAFEQISGYTRAECKGHPALILQSNRHTAAFYRDFWAQIKQNGLWRGEIWNHKKNGELFASILSFSTVNDNDGNLLCYLGMLTDITQLKLHQQEIEDIAYHDALTSLPNRPLLADRMQQALARVDRNKDILAVACLDLDGFKAVNDSFGHDIGDALLVEVGNRLLSCVRSGDTVARLGGDEFAILLCEVANREQCEITLQRILKALIAPYNMRNAKISEISASIGYTLFPDDNVDPDTLLRHADQAMYAAKQAGKNRFHYFDLCEDKLAQANFKALTRIEKALQNDEFCLYVQPKIHLKTGQLVGAEALIRWLHPIRGLTPPNEFLPLLEDNDLAVTLGEWVIGQALNIMQNWHEQGLDLPLSVNISAHHLRQKNFVTHLATLLQQYPHLKPGAFELEIIETSALDDLNKVSKLIAKCQGLGVHFALDDFGTGYSALTYLKRLAVNTLKIDQSFIRDLLHDENDLAIVRGVIGMANAFDIRIVAEGVENWQQAAYLLTMNCQIAQGYAIAHPMPADELLEWAKHFRLPEF